ncbi:MAG TPA: hypothetical protein VN634_15545 [Candidatus Limnocylindrales bacterium]|nr:hypothetical protein [Candidatus Limnocylindrales bacterium]
MPVHAQQIVLAAWALLAGVLLGLGLLERRLFGPRLTTGSELWTSFWIGWAVLLVGLELWHSFLPIDDRARVFFTLVGAAGWIVAGTGPWRVIGRLLTRYFIAIAAALGAAYWLSNQALAGPRFGDTGMYLVPTMHWYESFAIVPGLANLFVPLGNNITYFLYGALLDGGPFAKHVYPLINTLLALALLARGLFAGLRLVASRHSTVGDLFYALALVPLLDIIFSLYLTSPMPDTAVFLYGLVLAGELVELLASRTPSRARLLRLVFLSAAALTVKLSIAGLAVATPAVALLWWIWRTRPPVMEAAATTAFCALVALIPIGPWIARNIVLSGYPLYPAMIFPLPVDWIARVDATAWIQRPMELAPLWTIFRDTAWWKLRLTSLGWDGTDVMRPLVMLGVGLALVAVARPVEWWRRRQRGAPAIGEPGVERNSFEPANVPPIILLAPLAAFVFTFLNTPMPRYQGATLWMFGIDLVILAIAAIGGTAGRLVRVLCVLAVVAVSAQPAERREQAWLALKDFEGTSPPRLHEETLPSGLVVRVPENQVCWYAPLPCTPEPHPGLYLRRPGDLAGGFAIDPSVPAPPTH